MPNFHTKCETSIGIRFQEEIRISNLDNFLNMLIWMICSMLIYIANVDALYINLIFTIYINEFIEHELGYIENEICPSLS